MTTRVAVLGLVALLAIARPAHPWGCDGHHVVALLAWAELSPRARDGATELLGAHPIAAEHRGCERPSRNVLAAVSTWADAIRDDEPKTAPWHYVNVPLDAARSELRRGCRFGNCILSALQREIDVLRSSASGAERARALRFVVHLVADLHQPLHATTNGDRGGNCLPVAWFDAAPHAIAGGEKYDPNLHEVWDVQLVRDLMRREGGSPGTLADALRSRRRATLRRAVAAPVDVDTWAWEAHEVGVRAAYGRLSARVPREPDGRLDSCLDADDVGRRMLRLGAHVDAAYVDAVEAMLEEQLTAAGGRLARVLNEVWP
ncbi:MAG TPA: S1/P1 nuclease [Candidatus Eisenbacteria bacterium]|nr:S1/P1 nuclease [Candidatus Eisenbacteria bacterium]